VAAINADCLVDSLPHEAEQSRQEVFKRMYPLIIVPRQSFVDPPLESNLPSPILNQLSLRALVFEETDKEPHKMKTPVLSCTYLQPGLSVAVVPSRTARYEKPGDVNRAMGWEPDTEKSHHGSLNVLTTRAASGARRDPQHCCVVYLNFRPCV
jgi:hypothetical protein